MISNEEYGLIVERIPVYWNDRVVDEKVNVSLNYRASDYKNRKAMYNAMLKDLKKVTSILENDIKAVEQEDKR